MSDESGLEFTFPEPQEEGQSRALPIDDNPNSPVKCTNYGPHYCSLHPASSKLDLIDLITCEEGRGELRDALTCILSFFPLNGYKMVAKWDQYYHLPSVRRLFPARYVKYPMRVKLMPYT